MKLNLLLRADGSDDKLYRETRDKFINVIYEIAPQADNGPIVNFYDCMVWVLHDDPVKIKVIRILLRKYVEHSFCDSTHVGLSAERLALHKEAIDSIMEKIELPPEETVKKVDADVRKRFESLVETCYNYSPEQCDIEDNSLTKEEIVSKFAELAQPRLDCHLIKKDDSDEGRLGKDPEKAILDEDKNIHAVLPNLHNEQ